MGDPGFLILIMGCSGFLHPGKIRDDTIDALRHSIFREGISQMMEDPGNITLSTHCIMVARYLEHCGNHACKIAENVHYLETGERIEIH